MYNNITYIDRLYFQLKVVRAKIYEKAVKKMSPNMVE